MTPHATNTEDVLLAMAADGDPSAFYSLFAETAFGYYREVRAAGRTHDEATKALMPFMARSYVVFVTKPPKAPLKEWLDESARSQLKVARQQRAVEHGVAPTPTPAESADFDARLQSRLQREYSLLRQEEKSISAIVHFGLFLRRHPVLRLPFYAVVLCGLVAAGYAWLALSGSVLQIRLKGPGRDAWLVLPGMGSAVDLGTGRNAELRLAPPTATASATDTTIDSTSARPTATQTLNADSDRAARAVPAASIPPVKRASPRPDLSRSALPPSSASRTPSVSARPTSTASRTPEASPAVTRSAESVTSQTSSPSPAAGTTQTPPRVHSPRDSTAMPTDPTPAVAP